MTNVTWNGITYSIPAAGEKGWPSLSDFLIALGNNAAISQEVVQALNVQSGVSYTVSATTDYSVLLTNAAARAVTLPAGVANQIFLLVDGSDASTGNITITPNGAELIAGAATLVLNKNKSWVMIQYHAGSTDWKVIAQGQGLGNLVSLSSGVTGTLPIGNGGTGQTTANTALNALLPAQTANRLLKSDGTNTSFDQASLTTDVSGTLPLANGGTNNTAIASGIVRSNGTQLSGAGSVALGTEVTGNLPVTSGGTGVGTLAVDGVLIGNGASAVAVSVAGLADQVFRVPGSGLTPAFGAVDLTKAAAVTGALGLGNGGTGQTTANTALNALLPAQAGNANKYLKTNATDAAWDTLSLIDLSDADPTGAEDGQALVYSNASSKFLPGASGDSSFKLQSIAINVLTIKGGFLKLNDGRELATYNGAAHGSDITVALLTLFAAPVDNTTYWLYIDIDALGAEATQSLTGRKLYSIQQAQLVLTATKPESINRARYVPLGSVVGEAGTTYEGTNFTTYAAKSHSNSPLAINPKVYSLSQAVGSVGSASQIKAGHILAAESFPSAIGATQYSFYGLVGVGTDGNTSNAKNLSTGTVGTAADIFGTSGQAASFDGSTNYLQSTDAFFSPDLTTTPIVFGGWFKNANWATATDKHLFDCGGTGASSYQIFIDSSGNIHLIHTSAAFVADSIQLPNPAFSANSWHHIVGMMGGGATSKLKLYVDGKLVGEKVPSGTYSNPANDFTLGRQSNSATRYWNGSADEVFFTVYTTTDADIRKLYASKLAHGANVSAANQDWKFVLGSGVQKVPSISPVVDQTSSNTLYADFSDLDAAETVDVALLDMGMTAVAVPAVPPFDQTYTSNPTFPISHGLSEVPSLQVGYKDASNDWHWTTGEGAVKADSTQLKGSIQTYFDAAATHVRIRAVVGASPTGVKEATASAAGIVKGGTVPGATDGVAVAAGYLGEIFSAVPTAQTATGYNSAASCASLSLTAGVWLVTACCSGSMGNRPTGAGAIGLGWDIYNSTAAAILVSQKYVAYYGNASGDADSVYAPGALACTVNLTASATLQFRVRCDEAAAGTGTPDTGSRAGGLFQAIRIG